MKQEKLRMRRVIAAAVVAFAVEALGAGPTVGGGGTGPIGTILKCANNELTFQIDHTAVITFKFGVLHDRSNADMIAKFKCDQTPETELESDPSVIKTTWTCREYPLHDGNFIVRVEEGGFNPFPMAHLSQMQTHPLKPLHIATLMCELSASL